MQHDPGKFAIIGRTAQMIATPTPPLTSRLSEQEMAVSIVSIPLNHGKTAIIDGADFPLISGYNWWARIARRRNHPPTYYAVTKTNNRTVTMHQMIVRNVGPVDHKNGDTLDNRRANLRAATNSQNQANRHSLPPNKSARYRGVTWHKQCGKWQAAIKCNQKNHHLGLFDDIEDAARAYDQKAKELFGEFANPNFVDEQAA